MALAPLSKCTYAGCRKLTRNGRCERHDKVRTEQPRQSRHHYMYGSRWEQTSKRYRSENPLCVECLFVGTITAAECVDHIIPHLGREEIFWDENNYCSLCHFHHNRKTAAEKELSIWEPTDRRLVICGLPATGKTTLAKTLSTEWNCSYWDWDDIAADIGFNLSTELTQPQMEEIGKRRSAWMYTNRNNPAIMIVSRPKTAMALAHNMEANVHHCICNETDRNKRIQSRMKDVDKWRTAKTHDQIA